MTPCFPPSVVKLALVAGLGMLCLAGCAGDHKGKQEVTQGALPRSGSIWEDPEAKPRNHPPSVAELPASQGQLSAALEKIHTDAQASNNAMQQSFSGLGAQFGKIAERVDASLVKLEANVQQTLQANANLNASAVADVKTELRGEIKDLRTEIKAEIKASAQAQAQAQAQALGAVQMAVNARNENRTETLSAGRDNVQFTPEMAKVFISMLEQVAAIVGLVVGVVVGLVTALSVMAARNVRILAIENFKSIKVLAEMAVKVDGDPRDPSKGSTHRIPPLSPSPKEPAHVR